MVRGARLFGPRLQPVCVEEGSGIGEKGAEGFGQALGNDGSCGRAEGLGPGTAQDGGLQGVAGSEAEGAGLGVDEKEEMPLALLGSSGCVVEPPEGEFARGGAGSEFEESEGEGELGESGLKRVVGSLKLLDGSLGEEPGGIDHEVERWGGEGEGLSGGGEAELAGGAGRGAAIERSAAARAQSASARGGALGR